MKNLFLIFGLFVSVAANAVRLPAVLSDNMVLQQNTMVKLWGWGNPPEKIFITTSWNNKTDSVVTDGDGKWELKIPTPSACGPFYITISGNNTIVLKNILIGEVWICSGQSNMEMNYYWGLPQMTEDIPKAYNPNIRFLNIPRTSAATPQDDLPASWAVSDSNTVKYFSAVAYYFGKKLNQNLSIPIGLVLASWGGTPAEVWTPAEVVNNDSILKAASKQIKPSPFWPVHPGYTYNGMIAPLTNLSIAGAIWYQGESNVETAATYHQLFSSMIQSWRQKWNQEFPFYFVQLAPFHYANKNVAALLREAQLKTLALPKTGMAVINDLPVDTTNIHPKAKRDLGYRLSEMVLNDIYKMDNNGKMPLYRSMEIKGSTIELSFKNTDALVFTGKTIYGFEISGSNKLLYPATAKITGNKIIVSSKKVLSPVAVRYAFSNTAQGNVSGKSGMPLSPFRTDDWDVDISTQ